MIFKSHAAVTSAGAWALFVRVKYSPMPGTGVPGAMGLLMKLCWAAMADRFLSGGPPGAVCVAGSEGLADADAGAIGGRRAMGPGLGATIGTGRGVTCLWRSSKLNMRQISVSLNSAHRTPPEQIVPIHGLHVLVQKIKQENTQSCYSLVLPWPGLGVMGGPSGVPSSSCITSNK